MEVLRPSLNRRITITDCDLLFISVSSNLVWESPYMTPTDNQEEIKNGKLFIFMLSQSNFVKNFQFTGTRNVLAPSL